MADSISECIRPKDIADGSVSHAEGAGLTLTTTEEIQSEINVLTNGPLSSKIWVEMDPYRLRIGHFLLLEIHYSGGFWRNSLTEITRIEKPMRVLGISSPPI